MSYRDQFVHFEHGLGRQSPLCGLATKSDLGRPLLLAQVISSRASIEAEATLPT
jgi:hypothetical protein